MEVALREEIRRLEELQRLDAQVNELATALAAIPAKVQSSRIDMDRVEGMLTSERTQLGETQRYYREQKALLESDEGHVSGAKTKLSAAKNSREFNAAQKEIEQTRESVEKRQAEVEKLVAAMAAKEAVLAERANELKTVRASLEKDGEIARGKMAEVEGKIAAIKVERDKLSAAIKPDMLKRYGAIRMRRGLALVAVGNGSCRGCNMNIPPQLYNVLQRGSSIELCPYCHRMIYWEEVMKDPPVEGAAPADEAAPAKPVTAKAAKATKTAKTAKAASSGA